MNDAFVLGAAVVNVNVRTEKLRQGYVQATREAEQAGHRMGQQIAEGVDAGTVKAARSFNKMGREIDDAADRAGRSIEDGITSRLTRMASVAQSAFGAFAGGVASVVSADMLGRIGRDLIQTASDAAEAENKFNVAFGGMAESVRAWSEEASDRMGRSGLAFRDAASQVALVTTALGNTTDEIEEMATKLTERSVDIGSIFNVNDADAMRAIVSALTGEAEGVKRFGVVLNEAALEAQLLANGVRGGVEAATEAQKAYARYQIIIRDTAVAQGDAERTADGFANTTKRTQAELEKLKIELGEELLPIMTELLRDGVIPLVKAMQEMDPTVRNLALGAAAAAALLGPAVLAVTNLLLLLRQVPAAAATAAAASASAARVGALASRATAGAVGVAAIGTAMVLEDGQRQHRTRSGLGQATDQDLLHNLERERQQQTRISAGPDFIRGPRGQVSIRQGTPESDATRAFRASQERAAALEAELARRNLQADQAREAATQAATAAQQEAARTARIAQAGGGDDESTPRRGRRTSARTGAASAAREAARERDAQEREAERRREEQARVEEQIATASLQSQRELLQAQRATTSNALDRLQIDARLLDIRHQEERDALDALRREATRTGVDQARLASAESDLRARQEMERIAIATAAIDEIFRQEAQAAADLRGRQSEAIQQQLEADQARLDAQREAADIELEGIEDRRQAKAVLDRIADIERQRRDLAIEALYQQELLNGAIEEEARARRDAALSRSAARAGADARANEARTQGPMADYLDRIRGETSDGLERAQAGFLDDLNRGLVDVATNARSAKDVLRSMLQSFLEDLLRLQVNKAFLALFGGEAGAVAKTGTGGWIGSALSGLMGGLFGGFRADGGPVGAGRAYIVGERGPELMVPRIDGAVWNPQQLAGLGQGRSSPVHLTIMTEFGAKQFVLDAARGVATEVVGAALSDQSRATARAHAFGR